MSITKGTLIRHTINKSHVAQIVDIATINKNLEFDTKCNVSYVFRVDDIALSRIQECVNGFDWNVKKVDKGQAGAPAVVKIYMPELKNNMLFVQNGSEVLGFMNLPITISPYMVLSSVLRKPVESCFKYDMQVSDVGVSSDFRCKTEGCGNEANYSFVTNSQQVQCPVCRGKMLLWKLTKH